MLRYIARSLSFTIAAQRSAAVEKMPLYSDAAQHVVALDSETANQRFHFRIWPKKLSQEKIRTAAGVMPG